MRKINIGLIGFGTVGSSVYNALKKKSSYLKKRYKLDLQVNMVCDKDLRRAKKLKIPTKLLTKDPYKIINDRSIEIVIELIGGTGIAKQLIKDWYINLSLFN